MIQNVFVVAKSPNWWIKLGDFGVSKRVMNESTSMHTSIETDYTAPEITGHIMLEDESSCYTNAVDMWSVGCLIHWLLTKQLPLSRRELLQYCIGKVDFPTKHLESRHASRNVSRSSCSSQHLGPDFKEHSNIHCEGADFWRMAQACVFIRALLSPQPQQRLTAAEALNHGWAQEPVSASIVEENATSEIPSSQRPEPHISMPTVIKTHGIGISSRNKDPATAIRSPSDPRRQTSSPMTVVNDRRQAADEDENPAKKYRNNEEVLSQIAARTQDHRESVNQIMKLFASNPPENPAIPDQTSALADGKEGSSEATDLLDFESNQAATNTAPMTKLSKSSDAGVLMELSEQAEVKSPSLPPKDTKPVSYNPSPSEESASETVIMISNIILEGLMRVGIYSKPSPMVAFTVDGLQSVRTDTITNTTDCVWSK